MIVLGVLFALVVLGMTAGSVWVMRLFLQTHERVMKDTLDRFLARSPQELHISPIMQNEPPEKDLDEAALDAAKARFEQMMQQVGAPGHE